MATGELANSGEFFAAGTSAAKSVCRQFERGPLNAGDLNRKMVVARVPAASVADFSAWRYYRDGSWGEDFRSPSHLAGGLATEYSVTPWRDRFFAVYTDHGLSPRIMGRTADHP